MLQLFIYFFAFPSKLIFILEDVIFSNGINIHTQACLRYTANTSNSSLYLLPPEPLVETIHDPYCLHVVILIWTRVSLPLLSTILSYPESYIGRAVIIPRSMMW